MSSPAEAGDCFKNAERVGMQNISRLSTLSV